MARCLVLGHAAEEVNDLLGAGNDRQLARLLGSGQDLGDVPVLAERDAIEEAQGGDGDADRGGRELLLGGQEQLVVADLLGAEQVRGLAEMAGEAFDLADVARVRVGRQVANGHVLGHALAQWCDQGSPLRNRMGCAARGQRSHASAAGDPGQAGGKTERSGLCGRT